MMNLKPAIACAIGITLATAIQICSQPPAPTDVELLRESLAHCGREMDRAEYEHGLYSPEFNWWLNAAIQTHNRLYKAIEKEEKK